MQADRIPTHISTHKTTASHHQPPPTPYPPYSSPTRRSHEILGQDSIYQCNTPSNSSPSHLQKPYSILHPVDNDTKLKWGSLAWPLGAKGLLLHPLVVDRYRLISLIHECRRLLRHSFLIDYTISAYDCLRHLPGSLMKPSSCVHI